MTENGQQPKNGEDRVKFWLDRINTAKNYIKREYEEIGVDRFIAEYRGEYDVKLANMQVPPINEVYAYVDTLLSNLIFRDPYIAVNAKKTGTVQGAWILEQAVNYYWRELKTKEEIELELIDTALAGNGWHKNGIKVTSTGGSESLKVDQKFFSNRVNFRDIVWNVGSRRPPFDCVWMAQRIVKPTMEAKKQYGDRATGLKGGKHPCLSDTEYEQAAFKDDLNFSTLWEIWDTETKEILLVAEDHDRFLKKPVRWPEYLDEFPFSRLIFSQIPDYAFGIPDIKPQEPQILETIKLVAMFLNHVKRFSRQYAMRAGSIKESEVEKFEKGIDGAIIKINMAQGSLSEAIQPIQYAPFQPEVFNLLGILDQIKKNISGQPNINRGAPERTSSRTIGELEMIQEGSKSRTDRKIDRLETHIENIARHMIAHMQAHLDLPTMIKITGMPPQEILQAFQGKINEQTLTLNFSKEEIQGEYDVEVRAGSTIPLNKTNETRILQSLLEQSVRLAGAKELPPLVETIIAEILRNLEVKSVESAFIQQRILQAQRLKNEVEGQDTKKLKDLADVEKRKAQAEKLRGDMAIDAVNALSQAAAMGILPEAIELGRGMGVLPQETAPQNIPALPGIPVAQGEPGIPV